MKALLMVGGEGKRLRPLTSHTPKALLQLGQYTILDHAIFLLRRYGITDVTFAVNYLAAKIENHIGSGASLRIRPSFLRETKPLGTAGALSVLQDFEETVLMMNGDILTDIDLSGMFDVHVSSGAAMTVASKVLYTNLSLGVIQVSDDGLIESYCEKPRLAHRVSIGIYLAEPRIRQYLIPGARVDVPELITRLLAAGEKVGCYQHEGEWIDIGRPEDYAQSQALMQEQKVVCNGA